MSSKNKTAATKDDVKLALAPKLRFSGSKFSRNWEVKQLGQIAVNLDNRRISIKSSDRIPGDIPYYGASGIVDYVKGFIFDEDLLCVSEDSPNLVTRNYPIAFAIKGKAWVSNHAHVLGFENECTLRFVELYLNSIKLDDFISGVAQPKLKKAMLDRIPIPYPSLSEQKSIADCLGSIDAIIVAQLHKISALRNFKKGLVSEIFPRESKDKPSLRFSAFQSAGEWRKMKLGEAAKFYSGRAYKQEELLESGKYPVLRVGNFSGSDIWYYSNLELDDDKYCESGDLLYALSMPFGPRIWRGKKSIYHYQICKVIEEFGIDKQFIFNTLEKETENMRAKTTSGLGVMRINKGGVEKWISTFPTIAEQKKIVGCLASLEDSIAAEIKKVDALKIHKEGLMRQIFPSLDVIKL